MVISATSIPTNAHQIPAKRALGHRGQCSLDCATHDILSTNRLHLRSTSIKQLDEEREETAVNQESLQVRDALQFVVGPLHMFLAAVGGRLEPDGVCHPGITGVLEPLHDAALIHHLDLGLRGGPAKLLF